MNQIYINGRFLTQPLSGVQRYAREVVRALDGLISEDQQTVWKVLAPPGAHLDHTLSRIRVDTVGSRSGVAWELWDLPRAAANGRLLNLGNTGPLSHKDQIVTIHDAGTFRNPANFSRLFRAWYAFLLPKLARRARLILTVSNFSKAELEACIGVPAGKAEVVANGVEHILRQQADPGVIEAHGVTPGRYVLCLGAGIRNKNAAMIVAAAPRLAAAGLQVIRVGAVSKGGVFARTPAPVDANVRDVGRVTDAELRALYEQAHCFVFPSAYEGFGIPAVEAMACGCPTIVSAESALPETCGDAVLYCELGDVQQLVEHVLQLQADPRLRADLVARGLQRASRFSWTDAAARIKALAEAKM